MTPSILTGVANVGPGGTSVTGANLGGFMFSTGLQVGPVSNLPAGKLYTYAGGPSTQLTVTSNGSGPFAAGTLFTGYFSNNVSFLVTTPIAGKPKIHFGDLSATVTTTSLSAAMLSILGIPYQNHGTGVVLHIDVILGQGGGIQSGTITLVPEPGTLVLFGSGLVTLAGLLRKRLQ
ncbi:MAG: PEP-CTERM sorting domain-containing protein [Acidipila sp.]|nr:PEP-CTERM sorting domain-containing protein [Acidipila sp.]